MVITVYLDNLNQVSRVSQLTQKTNQFNLRTIRYSEDELNKIMISKSHYCLVFDLKESSFLKIIHLCEYFYLFVSGHLFLNGVKY